MRGVFPVFCEPGENLGEINGAHHQAANEHSLHDFGTRFAEQVG
jgi:hypothetical protein